MMRKRQNIFKDIPEIEQRLCDGRLFGQQPDPRDDLTCAVGILNYPSWRSMSHSGPAGVKSMFDALGAVGICRRRYGFSQAAWQV